MTKPNDKWKSDRQAAVAKLYFKGFGTPLLIETEFNKGITIQDDTISSKEVQHYLKLIKTALTPKTQRTIEYRRAQLRQEIQAVQQRAWEFAGGDQQGDFPLTLKDKIAALRVVVSTVDLRAKIEGVTQEKVVIDNTDETAQANIEELARIEKEAQKERLASVGLRPEEVASELPSYLKNGEESAE